MRKKLFYAAFILLLPCCQFCTQKSEAEEPDSEEVNVVDDGKPKAGEYTFIASPLKGQWKAGDQIYVHGSYGPAAQVLTLKASDISADGKSATLKLENGLDYVSAPDYLYAAWPASCVMKEDGLMDAHTTFEKADCLLAQAYLEGTRFQFDDASALISFTVNGDFDRVSIAGVRRPGLRFTAYTNQHSTAQTSFSKVGTDGYPFREEPIGSDKTEIWFPGGVSLEDGFTLYFGKDGAWLKSFSYSEDAILKAGKKLELGDITSRLSAYSGPAPKMPEMGNRTKYTIKLNEVSGLCLSEGNDFLWALGDGSEMGKISIEGELLAKTKLRTTSGSTLDSEGISLRYDTGDLLIGGEPGSVYSIPAKDVPSVFAESTFRGVVSLFSIPDAKNFGNAGVEGMTYYKDGLCYAGAQTGSYLFCCKVETGEVLWKKNLREKHPVITEIAGLCYDPLTDWLWVIDSESRRMFALTADAEQLLGFYSVKGIDNPESVCVDHAHSCIWVGDDYGSTSYLYRYDFTGLDDFIIKNTK